MKFGIVLHVTATYASWDSFLSLAREAEKLGFDSVWFSDHFMSPEGRCHSLDAWTVLSAMSTVIHKLRFGTYVLCNQFRHPSLLAKMASTADNISAGRLDLGIGAGWLKDEHVSFGFNWADRLTRVKRLGEAAKVVKKLWTEESASFEGRFYSLRNATVKPRPLQKPHPPLWIGGNSKNIMEVVAEVGDGWIPVLPTPRQLADGIRVIKKRMASLGRDAESLKVAYGGSGCALVAESETAVDKLAEPLIRSMGKPREELACLIGTPEQCIAKVKQYERAGAQHIVAGFYDFPSPNSMKLFAREVIPCFQ